MYGRLKPKAIALKITIISVELRARAKPTAVPKNGAVHGVDNNVAKKPDTKLLNINLYFELLSSILLDIFS